MENVFVLSVCLVVVFATLDVGLLTLKHNLLSEGARRMARWAIVHGQTAGETTPLPVEGAADEDSPWANSLRSALIAVDPAEVTYRMEWPDGGKQVDQRVQITVEHLHRPIVPYLSPSPLTLSAASIMRIQNEQ